MKPGIYEGLSFAEYKAISAINKSGLDQLHQSPAHYLAYVEKSKRDKDTPALALGRAIHARVLEPAEFEKDYICEPPDAPRRPSVSQIGAKKPSPGTIAQIEYWENFDEKTKGKIVLSEEDWLICKRIEEQVRKHPAAVEIFAAGKPEVTIVWNDPLEGVLCKARIDWLTDGVLMDVKSTDTAAPKEWPYRVRKYGLHLQAAWYTDGWKVLTGEDALFVFGAFEKEEPFASGFYYCKERVVELGRSINRRYLKLYSKCLKDGVWPSYSEELLEFDFPDWAFKEEELQPIEGY